MNKNIFNIAEEYLYLCNELEEAEGEYTPEMEEKWKINQEELKAKVLNYDKYIKATTGDIETANAEIERLSAYVARKTSAIQKLKSVLKDGLMLFGKKDAKEDIWRLEYDTIKLSTRKSEAVYIEDEDDIDDKYKDYTISKLSKEEYLALSESLPDSNLEHSSKISKARIKEVLKNKDLVAGAVLETKYGLTIK